MNVREKMIVSLIQLKVTVTTQQEAMLVDVTLVIICWKLITRVLTSMNATTNVRESDSLRLLSENAS